MAADGIEDPTTVIDLTDDEDGRDAATGDLSSMSKADLLERARDAGIKGRSSMTKEELVEAARPHMSATVPESGNPRDPGRRPVPPAGIRALEADLPVVLFFVDDLTDPVSTTMIASFEDRLEAFRARDVAVQGIVRAPSSEVEGYVATHGLRVRLVSDEHGDVARALGVHARQEDGAHPAGSTVVLFELVARTVSIEGLPPHAQAETALELLEKGPDR